MISSQVHFVQTGLSERDDIIVSVLSEAILGNWIHWWIGSLGYLAMRERFTKSVLTPFFARCTSIFLIFCPLSCCYQIKLSWNCVHTEGSERVTFCCTFENVEIHTLDKVLFSNDFRKIFPRFDPSWDWSSLNALACHASIPDPEMTWLLPHCGLFNCL